MKAAVAYQKKMCSSARVPKPIKLNTELENARKTIIRSFSLAKNLYNTGCGSNPLKQSELQVGAEFLEVTFFFFFLALGHLHHSNELPMIYDRCSDCEIICMQSNTALSLYHVNRLKQMGATIRSGSNYKEQMKLKEEKEKLVGNVLSKMTVEQLSDLMSFHRMTAQICSDMIETRVHEVNAFDHDS